MSSFFKRSKPVADTVFPFSTDMHSHILPGLDDGSPDIETSLQLIRGLIELGVKRSIATPHIIGDMYRNDADSIMMSLGTLQRELVAEHIDFEVSAAAEYMIDDYFLELLKRGDRLLTVNKNYLLVEFPFATLPNNTEDVAFNLINAGYTPILAHPERYAWMHTNTKAYHRLADLGFLLQVNALSVTGYYGKPVAKAAGYLIKENLVSFAGTDLHHVRHLAALAANKDFISTRFHGKTYNTEFC